MREHEDGSQIAQSEQGIFYGSLVKLLGSFYAPGGEHLVGIVVVVISLTNSAASFKVYAFPASILSATNF